jgi:2-dehydro-3-deoxygalactonokinase
VSRPAFLACDWGTTNLRAWVIGEDGKVIRSRDFPLGVSKLAPGEAARRFRDEVRPGLVAEHIPAILCGMIGSTLGWAVADYLPCPVGLDALRAGLLTVDREVRIVPGLRTEGRFGASDVMRGEETQLLGWLQADPSRRRGRKVVCHPGTHAKWALLEEGRVVDFMTSMTGELFAVLAKHSVLRTDAPPSDDAAFDEGVAAAGDGGALQSRLFSVRTRIVADGAAPDSSAAYLSGLLIGADVVSAPRTLGVEGEPVAVLGEAHLCRAYQRALRAAGVEAEIHDGDAAALAGLSALQGETVS